MAFTVNCVKYESRHTCVVLHTYVHALTCLVCTYILYVCTYVGIYVRTHMYVCTVRIVHDLQVESPVSLLSQDMSREYLHQQDAKKKYEVKRLCVSHDGGIG